MTRPRRDRSAIDDPNMRVTCSIRHSDYVFMVQKHFEFSAVLSKAIAQLRKREESEEEAIKAFYKERRAQLPEPP